MKNLIKLKEEFNKKRAIRKVKKYIMKNCPFDNIDWEDEAQNRFLIVYDHDYKSLDCQLCRDNEYISQVGYLKTVEDCKDVIRHCQKELNIIFKVKN